MINKYALTREEIVLLIRNKKMSPDGYRWVPDIKNVMILPGTKSDDSYFYSRFCFSEFVFFNENDLDLFLRLKEDDSSEFTDIEETIYIRKRFFENNKDLLIFEDIDTLVPPKNLFTIAELIDNYMFIQHYSIK